MPSSSKHLNLQVSILNQGQEFTISGTARYFSQAGSEKCFYLPYLDNREQAPYEPLKHLEAYLRKGSGDPIINPRTEIYDLDQQQASFMSPSLIKVALQDGRPIQFNFTSQRISAGNDILFSGFYPLPLKTCDPQLLANNPLQHLETMLIKLAIKNQSPWSTLGPGLMKSDQNSPAKEKYLSYSFNTDSFPLVLTNSEELYERHDRIHNIDVHLYFRSPIKDSLVRTIYEALKSHQRWFGSYPYESLTIIETESLLTADQPGLIAINQPRQMVFKYVQDSFLNWKHWVLSTLLAAQWYGTAIKAYNSKDHWLLGGICDFSTLMFLKDDGARFNLFNNYDT
ncbi:MAG: hypothetical protein HRU09_03320, partial [Oligoflexales bacterium]|nr:hypothetical protein [Oligoflexales bacterium]